MAKTPFILNDTPYGSERSDNAPRLAVSLARREGEGDELVEGARRSTLSEHTD